MIRVGLWNVPLPIQRDHGMGPAVIHSIEHTYIYIYVAGDTHRNNVLDLLAIRLLCVRIS